MRTQRIHVPEEDLRSLRSLLRVAPGRYAKDKAQLQTLAEELDRAEEVASHEVPPDVVTLCSRVLLRDLKTSDEIECVLVLPENADFALRRVSVVAPIGAAILGRRVGDVVTINAPGGNRRLRIKRLLYQPEAAATMPEAARAVPLQQHG